MAFGSTEPPVSNLSLGKSLLQVHGYLQIPRTLHFVSRTPDLLAGVVNAKPVVVFNPSQHPPSHFPGVFSRRKDDDSVVPFLSILAPGIRRSLVSSIALSSHCSSALRASHSTRYSGSPLPLRLWYLLSRTTTRLIFIQGYNY
jgi:hypothetical protein